MVLPVLSMHVSAQVTGPQQDCGAAIAVCQTAYVQSQSYHGFGSVQDLTGSNSCLKNDENNSVWYIFTVTSSGILEFVIIPLGLDDYDFVLYNLTGGSCADIPAGTANQVRCNYALTSDTTGLRAGYTNVTEGERGLPFVAPLVVTAGETYALVVDNFIENGSGYTLDFNPPGGGSTASIVDFTAPAIDSINPLTCTDTDSLIVTFSEPVRCNSIAANGSDFRITGPSLVTITGAYSVDCNTDSFTLGVVIKFASPILFGGNYTLAVSGSFEDNCGNQASAGSPAVPFYVPQVTKAAFTARKSPNCVADTFRFINNSLANYTSVLWYFDDGDTSSQINPLHFYTVTDTYSVKLIVTSPDCVDSVSNNVFVTLSYDPIFTYSPAEPCVNEPVVFTDSSGAAATDYAWNFGDGNTSNLQNTSHSYLASGIYNVSFTITDQILNCTGTAEMEVEVHENPVAGFQTADTLCSEIPMNFIDTSIGTPVGWRWTFADSVTYPVANPAFTFPYAGTFPVKLVVEDAFCGLDSVTRNLDVQVLPRFNLGRDTMLCFSEELTLRVPISADAYLWSGGQTSTMIVTDQVPDTVWAIAYLDGCPFSDSVIISEQFENCSFAVVPSGFSPNADGNNDVLNVLTKRASAYELIVYNRWGQEVYRGMNGDTGWDGSFKNEPQDIGVFSYVLRWKNLENHEFVERGNVTLIR